MIWFLMVSLKNLKLLLFSQLNEHIYLRTYLWPLGNKCYNMPEVFKNNERVITEVGE